MNISGFIIGYRKDRNVIIRFERSLDRMENYGLKVDAIRVECFDALRQLHIQAVKTVTDCIVNDESADIEAIVRQLLDNT